MKYHTINNTPTPGNYEGIYTARVDTSRESTQVLNLLTQSVLPAKSYKPFSDSVKVPPIENPIILNPNYKDTIARYETNIDESELRRKEKELAVKIIVERLKYVQSCTRDRNYGFSQQKCVQTNTEKYKEKEKYEIQKEVLTNDAKSVSKKDSDLQSIKTTAFNIIEENIKKAVSVAEQIKKEIDVEMTGKRQDSEIRDKINSQKTTKIKNDLRTEEEKRAFILGLQTIPYMKSYMQSNFFSCVLIKRIFLQLTKFMVSLTRHLSKNINIFQNRQKSSDYNSTTFRSEMQDFLSDEEYYEEKILSGAEMSRKFGKTPLEFTKRMDTVITEFEKRTGIEQTTKINKRSRSRSRSNVKDKLVNDDFADFIRTDSEGKNIYRAFVTEEWSEYYDLGKPKVNKTIKSEKFMESKSVKRETIEKLVEERTIQKESPLTYIAIVQAHVFTNQDAIIRDTEREIREEEKHEQRKITEALESKKESMIQTKKESASYTELEHQIIRINKEKPIEKVVMVESIEDVTPVEEYKSFPAIEKVKTGVATQKTTEILEHLIEIPIEKPANISHARTLMEPSNFSIAGSEAVVLQEEKDDSFMLPEVKPRKSVTLFEPPLKIIAGITQSDTIEPRLEILDITEEPFVKTICSIETPVKSIAQVIQVEAVEAQSRPLELMIPKENKSKELVQTPVQPVAVNMEMFIVQPKVEHIEIPETKTETSKVILEPLSTTVAMKTEVYIDEKTTVIDEKEPILEHLKPAFVPPLQIVAEKSETYLDESSETTSAATIRAESIRETFEQPNKAVAQTFETSTDIAKLGIFKKADLISENTKIFYETPIKTVAEIGEIYSEISEGVYKKRELNKERTKISMELPNKLIAQKIETSTEEAKIEELASIQVKSQDISSTMETASKSVAETNQTILSEQSVELESVMANKENILKSMEPMRSVAEKLEMYVNDIGEAFDKFKAKRMTPEFSIETPIRVTAEINETLIDEAIDIVENIKLNKEKIQTHIEPPCKTAAEVCITLIDESSGIYEKGKLKMKNSQALVETPTKMVAEIREAQLNEETDPFDKKPIIKTEKPNTSVEDTFKTLANTTDVSVNEDYLQEIEKFDTNKVKPEATKYLSFKSVPEISEVILSDLSAGIKIPVFNTDKSKVTFEVPVKTVAETIAVVADKAEVKPFEPGKSNVDKSLQTIQPPTKVVAQKSIIIANEPQLDVLNIEIFNTKAPKVLFEDTLRSLPETLDLVLEEPKLGTFELPKLLKEEGKITFSEIEPTVITEVLFAEPSHELLEVPEVKIKTPRPLVEEPLMTVPEILTTFLEGPKDDILVITKSTEEHALSDFERAQAASTTEISILEPQCDVLEIAEIKKRHHHTSLEEIKMTVSHIEQNLTLGPKDDILITPSIVKASANLKIGELKALEGLIIISEEAIEKALKEPNINVKQPTIFVEDSNKTVAESILVRAVESEKSFSLLSDAVSQVAGLTVQSLASLVQTATVPLEEVRIGAKHTEIIKNQAKVFIEDLSAANVVQMITLSSVKDDNFYMGQDVKNVDIKVESFDTFKAKINEVDVKDSKVEITEIIKNEDVAIDYKVELAKNKTMEKISKKKEEVAVELNTEVIKKDIEYMENGMTSIIQSVEADMKSKPYKKATVAVSEVKFSESESSKSPSPTSPINDVYLFCVATPYARHAPETPVVELDYKSAPKRRYTQAEISVAESIGIEYQISDCEDEVESMEIEYEKDQYECDLNMSAVVAKHKMESQIEDQSLGHAIQSKLHNQRKELTKAKMESESHLSSEYATVGAKIRTEMTAESEALQIAASKKAVEIGQQSQLSTSKLKSTTSIKTKQAASLQQSEALLQTENQRASLEMASYHSQVSASEIQSLEQNRQAIQQDIKILDTDIEHTLLSEHDASNITVKQIQEVKTVQQTKAAAMEFVATSNEQRTSMHLKADSNAQKTAAIQLEAASIEGNSFSMQYEGTSTVKRMAAMQHEALNEIPNDRIKSPPIEPATPLTDEYVFRLTAPLPSREGTPVPRDCTSSSSSESEEEIRRKLIPHIDLSIEQRIFDPPLPTPPTSPPVTISTSSSRSKPFYSKPGLRGGGDKFDLTKEEVLEIGRQSNLLASAIDKTIKRIEDYKSKVGIMEYAASEMSSSESRTVSEYQSDNKVEVLIDKMVETSRRFSGEDDTNEESGREFIVPIVKEYSTPNEEEPQKESGAPTNHCTKELMKERNLSEQLLQSVQSMVDPNASLEERLAQMQTQIAELSKLPDIIKKTIEDVRVQFEQLNYQVKQKSIEIHSSQKVENIEQLQFSEKTIETQEQPTIEVTQVPEDVKEEQVDEILEPDTEIQRIIEKRRLEAESKTKEEIMKERLSQELRIAAERLSPKLDFEGIPKTATPYFDVPPKLPMSVSQESAMGVPSNLSTGVSQESLLSVLPKSPMSVSQELPMCIPAKAPKAVPQESVNAGPALRETVKPVGKVWKKLDNYDDANLEQMLSETLTAQAEVIKGKAIGVNFMKYEKPPPPLEHLQNSEVYKVIHEMDQKPLKKVELLKPAIAASDYVERLRSVSPAPAKTLIEDCEV